MTALRCTIGAFSILGCGLGDPATPMPLDSGTEATSTAADGVTTTTGSADASGAGTTSGPADASGDAAATTSTQTTGAGDATGAGETGSPSACEHLVCDDFESATLDPRWTRFEIDDGNTIDLQSDVVASGTGAVRMHAVGGSNLAMMFAEGLPAELHQHYFGRVMFRATDFPFDNGGHSAYVLAEADLDGFPYQDHHLEIGSYYDTAGPIWQLTYWTGDGPEYIGAGGHIPQAAWFCLEWEFNDEPNQIRVWVDGSESDGAAFDDIQGESDLLGDMTTLGLGFRTWHPMGAPDIDLYFDDLALDTERIGCP